MTRHAVTCRTAGCSSEGQPRHMVLTFEDPETGETSTVDTVLCGACGRRIEDIAPPLHPEAETMTSDQNQPADDQPASDPADEGLSDYVPPADATDPDGGQPDALEPESAYVEEGTTDAGEAGQDATTDAGQPAEPADAGQPPTSGQ